MTTETTTDYFILGETLRPLMTRDTGAPIEIFDTSGPTDAGPPPHRHAWDEIYVGIEGEVEVTVDGATLRLGAGDVALAPGGSVHSYRNATADARFLTIIANGQASGFYAEAASDVAMNPPDIPALIAVGESHGIEFVG